MIQGQAGRRKGSELCLDLGRQLSPYRRPEEYRDGGGEQIIPQSTGAIDQIRNQVRCQHRCRIGHGHMQPNPEVGKRVCPPNGVGGTSLRDHQAGAGQHAVTRRLLYCLINRYRKAEIVGRDDQPPVQPTILR